MATPAPLQTPPTSGFRNVPYAEADEAVVPRLLSAVREAVADETRVDAVARSLIEGIRARSGGVGGLEDFLREYGLSTREGLALMVMAEALLRVPDSATQQALIEEKIGVGDWAQRGGAGEDGKKDSSPLFVSAATWGLGLSTRVVRPGETPEGIVSRMVQRLGRPAVRTGVQQAMRFLGHQFVLGESIDDAMKRASGAEAKGYRHSYDMLGEGARSWKDAARYKRSYSDAIESIGKRAKKGSVLPDRPGISVKLSALHPKYTARNRTAVLAELVPDVLDLARAARRHELNFTVDAEEADRLELSLEVIDATLDAMAADGTLDGWIGFGLAVQSYQKRAPAVIDHVAALGRRHGARLMVRLVKGAYWDTEVKHAQVDGLDDFPVFTRKAATDLSYLACAARMLDARPVLFPQFATHNALTVATILEMAAELGSGDGAFDGFEFQRLHGMGEALYEQITEEGVRVRDRGNAPVRVPARVYAPVGGHRDLLAYLVRRLLENGANSSFVARVTDKKVPVDELLERPSATLETGVRHSGIPHSAKLFEGRRNSRGFGFGERAALDGLVSRVRGTDLSGLEARALVGGQGREGTARTVANPADGTPLGTVHDADAATVDAAFASAREGFAAWNETPAEERAKVLERAADLLERRRNRFLAILAREAGKTLDDGIAEVREAVDFLRYYANEARRLFVTTRLPGPAGEENLHRLEGRGTFVTVAPWNFPLAIFLGQTGAALAAGNAVVAKPAPQTAMVAYEAVRALHEAGVPGSALQFVPGGPDVGIAAVAHPDVMGVAFTGSTATARAINRALAAKDGPIVPLIAETGGINALIVDATALPEQVADDVVMSAFRSAGQRCSALRVLYLQEDVYDTMIAMIEGAAATLVLGDPTDPATDVGPIIDADARARLETYIEEHRSWVRWTGHWPDSGTWLAPHILEVPDEVQVDAEVFGPVLHVKRWKAGTLETVLDEIEASGYGLTFGVHTRIDKVVARCIERAPAGNVYVNRNTIGAIVGSQPFGGAGLSGTGPKAGGPHYLPRFAHEVVVSTDTTAAGGNASLIAMGDG